MQEKRLNKPPCPSEDVEQTQLFAWAAFMLGKHPELELMHHIPNGGKRGKKEGKKFKDMGVKAGMPDIFLPCARGKYHGMYIELKKQHGGSVAKNQKEKMAALSAQGYLCVVCKGEEDAENCIMKYLELGVNA